MYSNNEITALKIVYQVVDMPEELQNEVVELAKMVCFDILKLVLIYRQWLLVPSKKILQNT